MIAIIPGMSPAEFVAAFNDNIDTEYGCSTLTIESTISDINDNLEIIQTKNPNVNIVPISVGMKGSVIISSMNNNMPNSLKRYVYRALGDLTGSDSDIYKSKAWIDGIVYTEKVLSSPPVIELNPAKKYLAVGWADYFFCDPNIMLALGTKYGFNQSFYRQIIPKTDDYLTAFRNNRAELKMIEAQGNYDGNHSFMHIAYITAAPLYDGRITPSNDDLRVARADGTNEFGNDVDDTLNASIGAGIVSSWLRLASIGTKAWKDLTDADCDSFRKSMSAFGMPLDGQNGQKVLEALDTLSNRYCGTTGYSVLDGDYTTRTPNTVGGAEPDSTHLIQGGIFQNAASTCNHEIWERLLIIDSAYKYEFEGKLKDHKLWYTPGGNDYHLYYKEVSPITPIGRFIDKAHTQVCSGAAKVTSSINGTSRSWFDCLRSAGYKVTGTIQGNGYGDDYYDGIYRTECNRMFKRNSLHKKIDYIGDGCKNILNIWWTDYTATDIDNAIASGDAVKYIYDSTFHATIDNIISLITWGLIPYSAGDSGTSATVEETKRQRSSMALHHEVLMQFCKRAGIDIISYEQAAEVAFMDYSPTNYFPNPNFDNIVKTVLVDAVNTPTYPDGWNGGEVLVEDTGAGETNVLHKDTDGTIFTRQYSIKPGTFNFTFKAKGVGTLNIHKILNTNFFVDTVGSFNAAINTISINSPSGYTEYTATVLIPDVALEENPSLETPKEKAYANYMQGYGNKICGIEIDLIVANGNYVKIGNPILTKTI